jgi:hypothetical protein
LTFFSFTRSCSPRRESFGRNDGQNDNCQDSDPRQSPCHDECVALATEKAAILWKMGATAHQGCALAVSGKELEAVQTISAGMTGYRSTGATVWITSWLSHLALAHAEIGEFDEAWRCVGEAKSTIETTKEKWYEPEVNRVAGQITLKSPEPRSGLRLVHRRLRHPRSEGGEGVAGRANEAALGKTVNS